MGEVILKGKIILEKEIEKGAFSKGGEASSKLKESLDKIGISPQIVRRTSIVTYEIEINIIIHSEGGTIKVSITPEEIIIHAEDKGPGIENLDKAFEAGYSTATEEIRELGFGAGMGLNNIKNNSPDKIIIPGITLNEENKFLDNISFNFFKEQLADKKIYCCEDIQEVIEVIKNV